MPEGYRRCIPRRKNRGLNFRAARVCLLCVLSYMAMVTWKCYIQYITKQFEPGHCNWKAKGLPGPGTSNIAEVFTNGAALAWKFRQWIKVSASGFPASKQIIKLLSKTWASNRAYKWVTLSTVNHHAFAWRATLWFQTICITEPKVLLSLPLLLAKDFRKDSASACRGVLVPNVSTFRLEADNVLRLPMPQSDI